MKRWTALLHSRWIVNGCMLLALTACGGGSLNKDPGTSGGTSQPQVVVQPNPAIVARGASTTLSWNAKNANSCTASGGWSGTQPTSGKTSIAKLTATTTFTLTCTGNGGSATQSAQVIVTDPPTVTLTSDQTTVDPGASATLTWNTSNATSCQASGGWSGAVPVSGSQSTGSLNVTTDFVLTCTGDGGTATQSVTITVAAPAPSVTISATPSTVASGSSATLNWSATDATSCTASGAWSGAVATSGSQSTGALTADATYTLTCSGPGGTSAQSTNVTVNSSTAPSVSLTASPTTIASGGSSTITWAATNASTCTASGSWSGTKTTSGSQSTGALTTSSTYVLLCSGPGGSAMQSVTVSVTQPAPTVTISSSPSTIANGSSSTLTWSSKHATSCTASGGWSGTEATSGSQSTGALSSTTKFTLKCSGTGGTAAQSTTVTVKAPAPTLSLSASPTTVASGGSSTLTWSATNATSCTASGGWSGSEATSGSVSTGALTATTTYTLSCTGSGGSTSQSTTVTVNSSAPTVSISASPSIVTNGGSATLTWSSSGATSCTASGAWSGSEPTAGSQSTGALTAVATYTLSCTGAGGTTQRSTTVTIGVAGGASCTSSNGGLTLNANAVRVSGISPLLVFFDATGTTDSGLSGQSTAFQGVHYSWDFGDTGISGSGTWAYGSNPGNNSKNSATGGVAAHLYITPGADTAYTVTVTAYDGTNTASCQLGVTAYDPAGANGFAGTKTTCVAASSTPAPGSGGCPAGAAVLSTGSLNTALSSFGSGKRVLFKCGDTFTGSTTTLTGTRWSVGAYGGCEATQSNRPILNVTGGYHLNVSPTAGDGRIADIDFEGNGTAAGAVSMASGPTQGVPYQITLSNLYSNGNAAGYYWAQGAQWGLINSVQANSRSNIAVFLNSNENNPAAWTGVYPNLDYQAVIGNFINGVGGSGSGAGIETLRVSACRMCVIENNQVQNANAVGAVFKLHNGNTNNSISTWSGIWTEYIEISDNLFTGTSGAQLVENAPQNGGLDERIRYVVFERNLLNGSTQAQGGVQLMVSAQHETIRDNVFHMVGPSNTTYPILGIQAAQRGSANIPAEFIEVYNNTCYAPNARPSQACVGFDTDGSRASAASNSIAQNNLYYVPSATGLAVDNTGSANTVSNNTGAVTSNPGFTNSSGSFSTISDFTPTTSYSGAVSVPTWYDAVGTPWSPTWNLGALHH